MTVLLKFIVVIAGLALVGSAAAACTGPAGKPPAPTRVPASSRAPAPTTVASLADSGVRYRAVDDLCHALDLSALTEVLKQAQDPEPGRFTSASLTNIRCNVSFGDLKAFSTLDVMANIYTDPHVALIAHEGQRRALDEPTADIPGLGTAAYSYVDKVVGPQVEVYDGNLTLSVGMISFDQGAIPADAIDRLTRVAAGTLPRLRA